MNSIGYLVSFATLLFGLLVGRYWNLLDYRNTKDRELLKEFLTILPEDKIINLNNIKLDYEYHNQPIYFLNKFLEYCNYPRVKFYHPRLEKKKNILLNSVIKCLDEKNDAFVESSDTYGNLSYKINSSVEGEVFLNLIKSIYSNYENFILTSRKV